ncbi:2-oxo acid dehydrogenase subunit E2 [Blastococcus sp. TF02-09]|uniref:dihydrolipoamide acetyltransferase family protein n=1 Tax=Blastococcus sp. TF02-09 TaxID=2250576 RepID=UPI000DE9A1AA|nr:dihydrolipoamide acetyltransferase family protein [Blastococcus sp. TF02-9]RBY76619.1 2-oxo acid dehydrogenase subunit E2 [Blastococcus sp. TF02-9]
MTQTAGALRQFRLPDVGEGLTEAELLQWLVAVGDTVAVNQPLCEVETAKAAVELPSPHAGRVVELLVDAGATVDVGTPIITIDTGEAPSEPAGTGLIGETTATGRTAVLVGYGPRTTEARRRPRRTAETGSAPLLATAPDARTKPVRHGGLEVGRQAEAAAVRADAASSTAVAPGRRGPRPLAKPPVRRYAKDCGVDLATVSGTGAGGVITRADVDAARAAAVPVAVPPAPSAGEQRIPVTGVRKHTAAAMVASAFTAPHVTEFLTVDVTRTMKLRRRLAERPELAGVPVSPLLFVAKAVLLAIGRHPMINSSWDEAAQEIVVHGRVDLGIAAATPRGLVVPNIRDAGRLTLPELAGALAELTTTARAGRTAPEAMTGGTFTITNVGVFGVDTGTPILNPGEAAILAFGAVRERPWVHKGKVRPRQVTTLALSFDHRIVDGELGSRFLADVGAVLQDPGSALLC